jgi:hypothetical protein
VLAQPQLDVQLGTPLPKAVQQIAPEQSELRAQLPALGAQTPFTQLACGPAQSLAAWQGIPTGTRHWPMPIWFAR